MDVVTLIIAVIALVLATVAFIRTGGIKDMRHQLETLSSKTETVRDRTADALDRIERLIRGREKASTEHGAENEEHPRPSDRQ